MISQTHRCKAVSNQTYRLDLAEEGQSESRRTRYAYRAHPRWEARSDFVYSMTLKWWSMATATRRNLDQDDCFSAKSWSKSFNSDCTAQSVKTNSWPTLSPTDDKLAALTLPPAMRLQASVIYVHNSRVSTPFHCFRFTCDWGHSFHWCTRQFIQFKSFDFSYIRVIFFRLLTIL